jgi:photosystem II stability/assembly factor-like uncharacterized protein
MTRRAAIRGVLLAIALTATASPALAAGVWSVQNPTTANLVAVSCPVTGTCFAVGAKGTIVTTSDGGANWDAQVSGTAVNLNGVWCVSATACFAVGNKSGAHGIVLATTDGGTTWTAQNSGTGNNLNTVTCTDASTCWAAGVNGAIVRTTDGGTTWSAQKSGTSNDLTSVACPSTTTCYAAGASGTMRATTDGGATWVKQSPNTGNNLNAVSCADTSTCWTTGVGGVIRKTTNGGSTAWTKLNSGTTKQLKGLTCPSATTCYAAGASGTLRGTTNGGTAWTPQSSGRTTNLNAIACDPGGPCFSVGDKGVIISTADGGTTWSPDTIGATAQLNGIACVTANTCWAAGATGIIITTSDGGSQWFKQPSGTNKNLSGITCPDANTCYAVGAVSGTFAVILKTADGGLTWSPQTSNSTKNLVGVTCTSATTCWAVGASGAIVTTADGGTTWTTQASGTGGNLSAISCGAADSCVAVGAAGVVLVTANGGTTWSAPSSNTSQNLNGVSCPDATDCIAVGKGGEIVATTDGGTTWTAQTSGVATDLSGISCVDVLTCWTVGAGIPTAAVLTTADGGTTWAAQASNSPNALLAVSMVSVSYGYAAGATGIIDAYVDDITPPPAPDFDVTPGTTGFDQFPTWEFTADDGSTTECLLTYGATVVDDWSSCTSPATYDLTGQPDGTYTLSVRATDQAGNTGVPATNDYTLDTGVPAAPVVTAAPTTPGSGRSPAWSFTAESGATVECELTSGATVVSDWAPCTSPSTSDLTGQPDGTYTFSVRATDAAGNVSPVTTSDYVLDATAPAAPAITSAPATPGSGRGPSWSFTAEAGATTKCRLDRGATVISDWASCTTPATYDLTGEPDGTYTFSVRATDAAGNVGAAATRDYALDTAAPTPTITVAPSSPGNSVSPSWSFSTEAGATVACRLDRGAIVVSGWAPCSSPRGYDLTGDPEGTYTFSVRATDSAANTGVTTSDYVLDTAAPAAPAIVKSPGAVAANVTPTWSFSGEPGASFECRLDRGATTVSDWAQCSSPRGYNLAGQPDGDYLFSVRAIDAAGNAGATRSSSYRLLTSVPGTPAIVAAPPPTGNGVTPSWSFAGEAGASFDCRVDRDGSVVADWSPCASPAAVQLTGQPDGAYLFSVRERNAAGTIGPVATSTYLLDTVAPDAPVFVTRPARLGRDHTPAWGFRTADGSVAECRFTGPGASAAPWNPCLSPASFDLGGRPDGDYMLELRATDSAGNVSQSVAGAYELDTTAPDAPNIESGPGAEGTDRTPTWSFSGEAGASFECRLTGVEDWAPCTSPKGYDLGGAAPGSYTFSVRATDQAGNVGPAQTFTYALRAASAAASPHSGPTAPPSPPAHATPGAGAAPSLRRASGARLPTPHAKAPARHTSGSTPPRRAAAHRTRRPVASAARPKPPQAVHHKRSGAAAAGAGAAAAVTRTVARAARVVAKNADKSAFPGALILLVFGFVGLQSRLDRSDPKLALAPMFADKELEFGPPPSGPAQQP